MTDTVCLNPIDYPSLAQINDKALKENFCNIWRGYMFIHKKPSMFYTLRKPNATKVSVSGIGRSL